MDLNFTSDEDFQLYVSNGIKRTLTAPYQPSLKQNVSDSHLRMPWFVGENRKSTKQVLIYVQMYTPLINRKITRGNDV